MKYARKLSKVDLQEAIQIKDLLKYVNETKNSERPEWMQRMYRTGKLAFSSRELWLFGDPTPVPYSKWLLIGATFSVISDETFKALYGPIEDDGCCVSCGQKLPDNRGALPSG